MSINTYLIVCCPQQKEFSLYFHFPQGMFTYSNEDTEEVVMDEGNRNGGSVYVSKEDGTRWQINHHGMECSVCLPPFSAMRQGPNALLPITMKTVQGGDHICRRSCRGGKQAPLSWRQCGGENFQVFLIFRTTHPVPVISRAGCKEGPATLKGAQGDVFSFTYSQDVMAGPSRCWHHFDLQLPCLEAGSIRFWGSNVKPHDKCFPGTPGHLAAGRRQLMWWGWSREEVLRWVENTIDCVNQGLGRGWGSICTQNPGIAKIGFSYLCASSFYFWFWHSLGGMFYYLTSMI